MVGEEVGGPATDAACGRRPCATCAAPHVRGESAGVPNLSCTLMLGDSVSDVCQRSTHRGGAGVGDKVLATVGEKVGEYAKTTVGKKVGKYVGGALEGKLGE